MNDRVFRVLLCTLALLIGVPALTGANPVEGECPLTCTPNPSGMAGGVHIGPPGTSFTVIFGATTPGLGRENPCASCPGSPCVQETSVVWNNNGTGWLMQYTYGGIQSTGLKAYARGGYMTAGCDDLSTLSFLISDPVTGGVAFSESRVLNCECPLP